MGGCLVKHKLETMRGRRNRVEIRRREGEVVKEGRGRQTYT